MENTTPLAHTRRHAREEACSTSPLANQEAAIVGDGALFDGVDSRIDISGAVGASSATELSIDTWIRFDGGPVGRSFIMILQDDSASNFGSFLEVNDQKVRFSVQNGTTIARAEIESSTTLVQGMLHHVAGTWKQGTGVAADIRVYIDGVDVTDAASYNPSGNPAILAIDSTVWAIGYDVRGFGGNFEGVIDDLGLHAVQLDAAEVLAIAEAGSLGRCSAASVPATGPAGIALLAVALMATAFVRIGNSDRVFG